MEINRTNLLSLVKSGLKRDEMSVSGLEREAGVPKDTIRDFLRGKTQVLRADKLQKILRVLEPQRKVKIAGLVGTGGEILFQDAAHTTDETDCPPGFEPFDVVAVRIAGNGMLPVFHDGWVIYYTRRQDLPIPSIPEGWQVPYGKEPAGSRDPFATLMGKPCVAGLADGRVLLGTLKPSAQNKGYDLDNYNASGLRNIKPKWVAKIIFIKTE
jgi:hypothetical protein